jgi:hypothetical protein
MFHKIFRFIHDLKVFFLAIIFLSFLNILGANPLDIGKFFGAQFGQAVGMSVAVPDNPFNKLAAQLKEKENDLNTRERALLLRERDLSIVDKTQNRIIYVIGAGVLILLFLIVTNFFLDYRRRRNGRI